MNLWFSTKTTNIFYGHYKIKSLHDCQSHISTRAIFTESSRWTLWSWTAFSSLGRSFQIALEVHSCHWSCHSRFPQWIFARTPCTCWHHLHLWEVHRQCPQSLSRLPRPRMICDWKFQVTYRNGIITHKLKYRLYDML